MSRTEGTVTLEDVRLVFRNFSGREGQYNKEGDRNFGVILDQRTANAMARDGWAVKYLRAREEGDEEQPYITVNVSFKGRPPRIFFLTSRGKTRLEERDVVDIDFAEIKTADVILRPYNWEAAGRTGVKAYLDTAYITIDENPLDAKYAEYDRHEV